MPKIMVTGKAKFRGVCLLAGIKNRSAGALMGLAKKKKKKKPLSVIVLYIKQVNPKSFKNSQSHKKSTVGNDDDTEPCSYSV